MQMGAGFKISYMFAFLKFKSTKTQSPRPDLDKGEVKRLEQALQVWVSEKRYRECSIRREEVASQLNTTREFLNSYFKHVKKMDFNSWRTSLRVEDAKKILLDRDDLPISLVGELVGFSDRSNFHRQFTTLVGCSPKKWRESSGKPA